MLNDMLSEESTQGATVAFVESVGERLLRFESAAELRIRPNWRDYLDPNEGKPFKIIGGYLFKKEGWLSCGLIGCKQLHGTGFVVRNAEGLETNIGHCCGKTRMGAEWTEMEALFHRQSNEQSLRDVLSHVLSKKQSTLAHAQQLMLTIAAARRKVDPIIAGLASDRPLKKAFDECKRNRGSLVYYRTLTENERAMAPGQTTVRATMGRIDGIYASNVDSQLERELKFKVIVALTDLTDESLSKLLAKDLEKTSLEFGAMGEILQRAELFVADTEKFANPKNWGNFEAFCDASKVNMSGNAYRILRNFAGTL